MEKVFSPSQTRNTWLWSLVVLAIIDVPLLLLVILGFQGPPFLLIIFGGIFILVDGLVLSLGFLGRRMRYSIGKNDFTIDLGLSKRRIPYSSIKQVQLSRTALLLRLFGASWPGLHWGLYKAKDVGQVWAYSTRMTGDFVLIELINGKKVAISPEDPQAFLNDMVTQEISFGTAIPSEVKSFEASKRGVYLQVAIVTGAFLVFLGYLFWIYPQLPEIIPVHFDLNWNPNRWAHKSELFVIAGVAAIFPIINAVLALKYGRLAKALVIFLGVVFTLIIALFFGILYFTQSII